MIARAFVAFRDELARESLALRLLVIDLAVAVIASQIGGSNGSSGSVFLRSLSHFRCS